MLKTLLLFLGVGNETFQIANPLGSNPAFYLQGSSTPQWLISILKWFDVFLIWQLVVLTIGSSILAKVSRGKAAVIIAAWVILIIMISGVTASFS